MLIPYNLKLRLERYKQDKIEAAKLEKELLSFQSLPLEEQKQEVEVIEVKQYKTYRSIARTSLTLAQQLKQKEYDRRYRRKKKERLEQKRIDAARNMDFQTSYYPPRNPVRVMRIKIKGEDF